MAYTLDISLALGSSQTGLTLSAQLVDTTGANVGSAVTTGFTEIGAGNYLWHYTAFPDGFRGGVKFSASSTLKAFVAINPSDGENSDAKITTRASATDWTTAKAALLDAAISSRASGSDYTQARALKLDLLGTGAAYSAGPVASNGDITIIQGDDYMAADSRALLWTLATGPSLVGSTITLTVKSYAGATELAKVGTAPTSTTAQVELTAANTTALAVGSHKFDVQATLATGRILTLARGILNVLEQQT